MAVVREPMLESVPIKDLLPTQITVGMREVKAKQKKWREKHGKGAARFLGQHMIPVILGPKKRLYLIDHHHLARALHEEGVEKVLTTVLTDLSDLDKEAFWFNLDCRNWTHPYDQNGRRRGYADLPKSIDGLVDDPYRSMAGILRRLGGFAKDTTPFSEFLWADFLRRRLKRQFIEEDFESAQEKALQLAKSKQASYLPGWCGPLTDH